MKCSKERIEICIAGAELCACDADDFSELINAKSDIAAENYLRACRDRTDYVWNARDILKNVFAVNGIKCPATF